LCGHAADLRVALGVAGGYLLGRTKKMKLALMLGGMIASRPPNAAPAPTWDRLA
jgi:hypothetical protein